MISRLFFVPLVLVMPIPFGCDDDPAGSVDAGPRFGPLELACGASPLGAVDATYSHQLTIGGGSGDLKVTAEGLPRGMALDESTGLLSGAPENSGVVSLSVTVEDNHPEIEDSLTRQCEVEIRPRLTLRPHVEWGFPCVRRGDVLSDFFVSGTGNEKALICSLPDDDYGNLEPPSGLSVDADTCDVEGSLDGLDVFTHGVFAWIVEAKQSGASVFVPYCAINDLPEAARYRVVIRQGTDSEDNTLVPGTNTFSGFGEPSYGVEEGEGMVFTITAHECDEQPACYFQYHFRTQPGSPLTRDTDGDDISDGLFSLSPVTLHSSIQESPDGLQHHLSMVGPEMEDGWRERVWIQPVELSYCITSQGASASDNDCIHEFSANSGLTLQFPVVMFPD